MAANEILNLNGAEKAGLFTSKSLTVAADGTRSWASNTDPNAKWYADSSLETAEKNKSIALVTTVAGGMKLEKGTNDLTGVTEITANLSSKKWTIEDAGFTGLKTIVGSNQDDLFTLTAGNEIITTGAGKDTIDVSGVGSDVTLADYTYGSDVIKVSAVTDLTAIVTQDGKVVGTTGKHAILNGSDGYWKATLTKNGNDGGAVWWGGSDARSLDASAETKKLVMITGAGSDTLIGGSKGDSIYASVGGNYVVGGAGADTIQLEDGTNKDSRQYVAFGADSGTDEVVAFGGTAGDFDETADVLVLQDGAIADIKITADTHTIIKSGSGSVSLGGVNTSAGNNAGLLMQEGTGAVSKVEIIGDTAGYAVATDTAVADYYISTAKTGYVNFTGYESDVVAELSNLGNYDDKATFVGIDSVKGGAGNSTLVGAADTKNYLVAGTGNSTLWGGGASNDTLVGGAKADAFFVAQYDGKDTITGFDATTEDAVDTLYMLNSPATGIKRDGNAAVLSFADGSSVSIAANGANFDHDSALRFTTDGANFQTAKIGRNDQNNAFTYSNTVDMYFGGGKTDTLTVAKSYEGKGADIRLNNTLGQSYSGISIVDASAYDGETFLSGSDEGSETLVGAAGKTTLWGGLGAVSDTLQGTNGGTASFYFGKNNGADVITNSTSDDKVVFYDFANTDLAAIDVAGGKMKFTFNEGSSLEIQHYTSSSVQTFEFTNSTFTYDASTNTFTQRK